MDLLQLVKERLALAIQEHVFPGAVFGMVKKNGERLLVPIGKTTYNSDARLVQSESIFDVASITKSIPTASLALRLIDEGRMKLEDKLINYIPEFTNSHRENILVKHLLTYTLDFQLKLSALKDKPALDILKLLFTSEFGNAPGEKFFYHNSSALLMGIVIERITGKPLDTLADEVFFNPLGMKFTSFDPEKFKRDQIIPTEIDSWRGRLIHGEVHDESAFALKPLMQTGHAGLFSTVPDLLTFMEMLLNDGELNGKRYLSSAIIVEMVRNQTAGKPFVHGLGWALDGKEIIGEMASFKSFFKTGFTGCLVAADTDHAVAFSLLSNRVHPTRSQETLDKINFVRRDIANLIVRSL
ncbi:MAG: beta-lactamase family protein [bacterium]|nr:beta-lactamase family protein [bacterium]